MVQLATTEAELYQYRAEGKLHDADSRTVAGQKLAGRTPSVLLLDGNT